MKQLQQIITFFIKSNILFNRQKQNTHTIIAQTNQSINDNFLFLYLCQILNYFESKILYNLISEFKYGIRNTRKLVVKDISLRKIVRLTRFC
ncbi:unnamed protein product [Paramecium sonneborni]|uniref:Uncharacterized protein n=1 Tax=Paramecium sonneborni TaxID=65129 RepID=A0A8S1QFS3_9CILI|nr:unnamed protein product [Paramecium sonneborni]